MPEETDEPIPSTLAPLDVVLRLETEIKRKKEAAEEAEEESSGIDPDAIAYVIAMEKFVVRMPDGSYNIEQSLSRDGAFHHLVGRCSVTAKQANKALEIADHINADTVDCDALQPQLFRNEQKLLCLNTYRPSEVIPTKGSWDTLAEVLLTLVGHDYEGMMWVFNWAAALVQKPMRRGMVSPVFSGPPGCGKTTMGDVLGRILGSANYAMISGEDLKDKFNSQYALKLFVVANEVFVGEAKLEISDKMKPYLTDPVITMCAPHAKRLLVRNMLSCWFTTNKVDAVKVEEGDRRYSPFVIPRGTMTPTYAALVKSLYDPMTNHLTAAAEVEMAAWAYDLIDFDVDWKGAICPYENEARRERLEASRTPHEQYFDEIEDPLGDGVYGLIDSYLSSLPPSEGDKIYRVDWDFYPEGVAATMVYRAYVHFVKRFCSSARPLGTARFGEEWKRRFGTTHAHVRRAVPPRVYLYAAFPPGSRAIAPPKPALVDENPTVQ